MVKSGQFDPKSGQFQPSAALMYAKSGRILPYSIMNFRNLFNPKSGQILPYLTTFSIH